MRQRQRRPSDTEEERAGRQRPRLTREVVHAPRRRHVLHLTLEQPRRRGRDHEGPAWMNFTFLYVYLSGERIKSPALPHKKKDIKGWSHTIRYPMDLGWRSLSVDIEAVREDFCVLRTGRLVVVRTQEPHTSGLTAVIGAVRVPLLDAVVLGDGDDSGDERGKKKKTGTDRRLAEGTREFDDWVELQAWRWEVGREPDNVVCGTVGVHMFVTEHYDAGR